MHKNSFLPIDNVYLCIYNKHILNKELKINDKIVIEISFRKEVSQ